MAARSIEELQKRYASLGKLPKGGPGGGGPRRGPGAPRPKGKPKNSRATVRRLLGYIGAHWFRLIFVFLCMLCSTLTAMVGTYLLRDVYNVLTIPADGEASAHANGILIRLFMPDLAATAAPTPEQSFRNNEIQLNSPTPAKTEPIIDDAASVTNFSLSSPNFFKLNRKTFTTLTSSPPTTPCHLLIAVKDLSNATDSSFAKSPFSSHRPTTNFTNF